MRAETIERLLIELEEHLYTGWFDEEGTYHETYQSPNGNTLLGGVEADENAENWMAAVHPDDRAAYEAFMTSQMAGDNASIEFRLCGADGVTRWMRERSKSQKLPGGAIEVIGIATDISTSRAAAAALAASEAKLEHVLKAVDAYVYVLESDDDGTWDTVSASPNRERFTGGVVVDGDAIARRVARPHPSRRQGRRRPPGRGDATRTARSSRPPTASSATTASSAGCSTATSRTTPATAATSGSASCSTSATAASSNAACSRASTSCAAPTPSCGTLRMQAEQQARTDVVTGAHNRLALSEHVALALEAGHEGGLVLLDLDHFKQINDALGHGAGDRVLVEVARRLRAAAQPCGLRGALGRRGVRRAAARRPRRARARAPRRRAPARDRPRADRGRRRAPDRRGLGRRDAADAPERASTPSSSRPTALSTRPSGAAATACCSRARSPRAT